MDALTWHIGLARAAALAALPAGVGWRATARLSGLERVLGMAIVALSFWTVATIAAGAAGVLAFEALLAIEIGLAAPCWFLTRGQEAAPARPLAIGGAAVAVALPVLAISFVRALLAPPMNWDSLAYHLPFAVHWMQTGSMAYHLLLPAYPLQVSYFPCGGEVVWLWPLVAWGRDALVGVLNHGFLALAAGAIAALARRLGAPPAAAAAGAAVFALMPIQAASLLGTANVDLYLVFAFLATILFLVHEDGAHAWLAALAAGLAVGIKLSAALLVPVALAVGLAGGWRPRVSRLVLGAGAVALVAGFWYARNAWSTGNPLYPLGSTALEAAERWADQPLTGGSLRTLVEAVWSMFGLAAPAGALAWLAHAVYAARARDRLQVAVAVAGAVVLASWAVTPNSANWLAYNLRYALPGMALLAVSLAVALTATEASAETLSGVGAALASALAMSSAPHLALPMRWALTAFAGLLLIALAWRARGLRLALAVALLNLLTFQLVAEHHLPRTRYGWFLADYHGGLMRRVAEWADGLTGARISVSGPLPPYYLHGFAYQNSVVERIQRGGFHVQSRLDPATPFPAPPPDARLLWEEPRVRVFEVRP